MAHCKIHQRQTTEELKIQGCQTKVLLKNFQMILHWARKEMTSRTVQRKDDEEVLRCLHN